VLQLGSCACSCQVLYLSTCTVIHSEQMDCAEQALLPQHMRVSSVFIHEFFTPCKLLRMHFLEEAIKVVQGSCNREGV